MSINRKEITKEMLAKAVQCRNADELIALAKTRGMEMTREEAEPPLAELADFELDADTLQNVAGGGCYSDCKAEAWL